MDKNLYEKTTVKVQKKSGFDKSHQNLFTGRVGTLVPILVDELIPNTSVDLEAAISAQLPPLASDTFMRCSLKYASFFVPTRLLVNGYERWLTGYDKNTDQPTDVTKRIQMPVIRFNFTADSGSLPVTQLGPGSLADYLGAKYSASTLNAMQASKNAHVSLSALPFLAYHRIYDDWFRNSLVQVPVFNDVSYDSGDYATYAFKNSKFVSPSGLTGNVVSSADNKCILADGVRITNLRQANFDIDLFTSAAPRAQNGNAAKVTLTDINNTTGSFTISALRSANSLQQWMERNSIAGNRMVDFVKAQYGANLSDAVAQRPILLGSGQFDVYSKGVYQTANSATADVASNPFSTSSGAKFGSAFAEGKDKLCKFTAQEPGYLMVLAWLSPHVTYATGVAPHLFRYRKNDSQAEMANPILQNVGNEPIPSAYIQDSYIKEGQDTEIFGFGDRYCSWKDKYDECHGELRDGETLQSFALQRSFIGNDYATTINSEFLKIPTTYLDQVLSVSDYAAEFSYWCDTYFKYKVSMPLARYSIPTLQDPAAEHGEDITVRKSGTQLT